MRDRAQKMPFLMATQITANFGALSPHGRMALRQLILDISARPRGRLMIDDERASYECVL